MTTLASSISEAVTNYDRIMFIIQATACLNCRMDLLEILFTVLKKHLSFLLSDNVKPVGNDLADAMPVSICLLFLCLFDTTKLWSE
jgi:hypothetical protein